MNDHSNIKAIQKNLLINIADFDKFCKKTWY